jgi:hypothetical protein
MILPICSAVQRPHQAAPYYRYCMYMYVIYVLSYVLYGRMYFCMYYAHYVTTPVLLQSGGCTPYQQDTYFASLPLLDHTPESISSTNSCPLK